MIRSLTNHPPRARLPMKTASHVLVCGGAGYIGSHMCERLARAGHRPVVLDNLSAGL